MRKNLQSISPLEPRKFKLTLRVSKNIQPAFILEKMIKTTIDNRKNRKNKRLKV
jgi:hypothetical protein